MEIRTSLVIPNGNGFEALVITGRHQTAPRTQESTVDRYLVDASGNVLGAQQTRRIFCETSQPTTEHNLIKLQQGTTGSIMNVPTERGNEFVLRLQTPQQP